MPFKDKEALDSFKEAAGLFIKRKDGRVQIWASSLDWFQEEWGRDTFISLPGLLLASGRHEEAKNNMENFSHFEKNGLIPNRIPHPDNPEFTEYNTVDAPLWFIQAVKKYIQYTQDSSFVNEILPVIRRIISGYKTGTGFNRYNRWNRIYMDEDGLISGPPQATWMDADPDGKGTPITPRNGKAVEINALWYSNLKFLSDMEGEMGVPSNKKEIDALSGKVKESFNRKFWNENKGALYDVIEGDPHWDAIRPNMVFAVSHGEDLLPPERRMKVVEKASSELLTPYGLRTLSPKDPSYHGKFYTEKPPIEKDLAYHQGTVWPWLIGAYADALAKVRKDSGTPEKSIREEIRKVISPLIEFLLANPLKTLPEVFDGDAPHRPGGTRSQAWSVSEVLRVLTEYIIPN